MKTNGSNTGENMTKRPEAVAQCPNGRAKPLQFLCTQILCVGPIQRKRKHSPLDNTGSITQFEMHLTAKVNALLNTSIVQVPIGSGTSSATRVPKIRDCLIPHIQVFSQEMVNDHASVKPRGRQRLRQVSIVRVNKS